MSGEGPESIPTSADPRSRRPAKRRALTPLSAQAKEVGALFTRPDQEIRVPPIGGVQRRRLAAPPEIVTNVQGSSAGAGSGEFHVYKASRRREYERLRLMDEEMRREKDSTDFEAARREREARDEEKTRRNREKREKKLRARQAKAKTGPAPPESQGRGAQDARPRDHGASGNGAKENTSSGSPASTADTPGLLIHEDD